MELRNRKFNHMYVGITQEFEPYGDRVVVRRSINPSMAIDPSTYLKPISSHTPIKQKNKKNRRTGSG